MSREIVQTLMEYLIVFMAGVIVVLIAKRHEQP